MAFSPIAFVAPNYRDYKNWWLKAYEPGTTTPKVMADNDTGTPTVAKYEINKDGFIVSSGGALIIPFIDGPYDLWLFPTEAEADANSTTNAERVADDVSSPGSSIGGYATYEFDTVTDAQNGLAIGGNSVILKVYDVIKIKERGSALFDVITGTTTANGYDIIAHATLNISFVLRVGTIIDAKSFGAVNDGTDQSGAILRAIEQSKTLVISDTYKCSVAASVSNKKIKGNGQLYNDTQVTNVLKLTGNSNIIEGITIRDKTPSQNMADRVTNPLSIVGNLNKILGVTVEHDSVPVSTTVVDSYNKYGIYIEGNDNIIENNEVRYMPNAVYGKDGFRNKYLNNYIHDSFVGIQVTSGESDYIIKGNHIKDCNIVDPTTPVLQHSGCDGILCSTGSRRGVIANNRINNCTEHGMYVQSFYTTITGNVVSNNGGSGIKLAGKGQPTINWNGETPVLKGTGGLYVSFSCEITGNVTFGNGTDIASNAGIYLQGGIVNLNVSANECSETSCSGIRTAYESINPDMRGINISGNTTEGLNDSTNFSLGCNSIRDSLVSNNLVIGTFIYGGDAAQKATNVKVVGNRVTSTLSAFNSENCIIEQNELQNFQKSNGTGIELIGNTITGQSENLEFNGIVKFSGNKIKFSSNFVPDLSGSTCKVIDNNQFTSDYTTPDASEVFFDYGFNASTPVNTSIRSNTFNLPNWERVGRFGGSNNIIVNNTISNDNAVQTALCFDIQGTQSDTLYSGNLFTGSGAGLEIRTGASNILVDGHMGTYVDNGTGTKLGIRR